jgi:hypothetical protein
MTDASQTTGAPWSRECDHCHKRGRLLMPVKMDCCGNRFNERLCVSCRLSFDRDAARENYVLPIEGRHGIPGASPVPCSLVALQWRAAHVR